MCNHSFKAVYIIAVCAALASPLWPGSDNNAQAQLRLPPVTDELRRLPRGIDDRLPDRVDRTVDQAAEIAEKWTDTAELPVEMAAAQAIGLADGVLREVQIVEDPAGFDIEDRVVVVLVDSAEVGRLSKQGLDIIASREMTSLGMTMLTLRVPANLKLPTAVEGLRIANPEAAVDYNHLYDFTASLAPAASPDAAPAAEAGSLEGPDFLRVGIIDSAVMREHPGVAAIKVVDRDFATSPGLRPQTHGTAVASLIAKSAQQKATVYAASVFFQLPQRAPGATAESLVNALDWLVESEVDVINMSLAGPGNALLEAAIARLVEMNAVIVAAVGNNGPSGEPLYPAAYDGVIGVTAVDKKNKVFRYANRGKHVQFAARGVNMKVADSLSGGWRMESGTSMASPHIAVVVAQMVRSDSIRADAVTSWLMANAEDLGRKGFDPVYGHGLITQPPRVLSDN